MIHVDDLLVFFSWFLFAAAGLSLRPHRAGIQDDEIQRRKSKKGKSFHDFWINKFLSAMTSKIQRELQYVERGWQ